MISNFNVFDAMQEAAGLTIGGRRLLEAAGPTIGGRRLLEAAAFTTGQQVPVAWVSPTGSYGRQGLLDWSTFDTDYLS